MKREAAIVFIVAYWLITSGCAVAVFGIGAAAGTGAAYVAGKDTRIYDAEYHSVTQACIETLNSLKIPVAQTTADELKMTVQARRADETPVTIEVVRKGLGRSEVGIRTGVVGIVDIEASNQIHDLLKERLEKNAQEIAKGNSAQSPKGEAEPPPEVQALLGPGHRTEAPAPVPYARRAPPELTIYFGRDSNELRPSETAKLDKVAEAVSRQPETRLTLNGYTDSVGSSDYNSMIAENRAFSIKLYLVAKGVNPAHITIVGKGARDFVAANESEEGRRLNRRVEIQIDRKP